MAAPYVKRYAGGFVDLPSQTTAVDSAFLNAVEASLLQLLGEAPAADEVGVWTAAAGGSLLYQKITNAQIDAAAAIAKSKLAALNIVDADVAGGAAIAKSKLAALNIVNADVDAAAAIALSKLAGYPASAAKFARGDGSWAPVASLATTLPGAPVDGQEAILTDSLTAPTYAWRFRYNAGSSSSYKWEFVGGAPKIVKVDNPGTLTFTSQNAFHDAASAGPSFTTPVAGDWDCEWGAAAASDGAASAYAARIGLARGGTAPTTANSAYVGTPANQMPSYGAYADRVDGLAAATLLKVQYAQGLTGGNLSILASHLSVLPIRVS